MKTISKFLPAAAGIVFVCASGCASIISGRKATVEIESSPSHATVVVRDKHGKEVAATQTPASVELNRKGKYLMPASYTATIEKPGYAPETALIQSTVNPWILGNLAFGGIIGLVIDNATGAAWQPKQQIIQRNLKPMRLSEPASAEATDQANETDQLATIVVDAKTR